MLGFRGSPMARRAPFKASHKLVIQFPDVEASHDSGPWMLALGSMIAMRFFSKPIRMG